MCRTLLSVGVQAGASLRERKSPGDFPNPPVSLPKSGGNPEKRLALKVFPLGITKNQLI